MRLLMLLAAPLLFPGCANQIDSDLEAEMAYLGLDGAIRKAVDLGFDGFNAADSANIPAQDTTHQDEIRLVRLTDRPADHPSETP